MKMEGLHVSVSVDIVLSPIKIYKYIRRLGDAGYISFFQ
jgi:hypothetical protein